MLPEPPEITDTEMDRCQTSGDYCPVLFKWYKFVGTLAVTFACLKLDSPALRNVPEAQYHILVGLLNRCARLMLANVALSHNGKFGETTSIIDRCIFESSVILSWLCRTNESDRFQRYTASGLKTEIEFKEQIQTNIEDRSGSSLPIEDRMLESIGRCIGDSGLNESEIKSTKKLPDLASMIDAIGKSRLAYVVGQRLGSHHVHGTWVSLHLHYLERTDDGSIAPRDHDVETHVNQYIYVPMVVLDALTAFVEFMVPNGNEKNGIIELFESTTDQIREINREVVGNDISRAGEP